MRVILKALKMPLLKYSGFELINTKTNSIKNIHL